MKKSSICAFILALCFALAGAACSENARPQNTTEQLFVAQWTLIGATNAVADLKDTMDPEDYKVAKDAVLGAAVALDCAKFLAEVPGATQPTTICPTVASPTPLGYLALANELLLEAATYYASKGD